ncbi:MAG: VCBS domain-containing protein, partial [Gammaproteobacteria bacterium]
VDDPATIGGQVSYTGDEGDAVGGTITASDVEGLTDGTIFSVSSAATHGTAAIDPASGSWTFTPTDPDWFGSDSFEVTITDDLGGTTTQVINITLANVDDPATIGGQVSYTGDEGDAVGGTITASDVEGLTDGTIFSVSSAATHGTAAIDPASGVWTFTPTDPDWFGSDSFEVTVIDDLGGTTTQVVNITLANVDDPATIGGQVSYTGDEGDAVGGTITASDVEGLTDGTIFSVSGVATHGTAAIDPASGAWTFTPTDPDWFGSDSFEVTVTDDLGGTTTQTVSITLANVDDPSVIAGTVSGSVTEGDVGDPVVTTSGTLTITDADPADNPVFNDVGPTVGDAGFGTFEMAGGTWTYRLDQAAVQQLRAGDTATDTFTFDTSDGSSQLVSVTITGTNDAAAIGGTDSALLTEGGDPDGDGLLETAGTLTVSDADTGEAVVNAAALSGAYGDLSIDAAGAWSYVADDAQAAVQQLGAGDSLTDSFTITTADGTAHNIAVTIQGTNDIAVIGGVDAAALSEDADPDLDGMLEASGTLSITDIDAGEAGFDPATLSGSFGQLQIDAAGNWSYAAHNIDAAIQRLAAGGSLTDVVTVTSADGTTHDIVVSILGADDPSLISAPGSVAATGGAMTFSAADGSRVSVSDVDANDVEVTLNASRGTVQLARTDGLNFLVGDGAASSVMRFTGSTSAVNAAMEGMRFTAEDGFVGTARLQVAAADSGPGTLTTLETIEVTVPAAPAAGPGTGDTGNDAPPSLDDLVYNFYQEDPGGPATDGGPGSSYATYGVSGDPDANGRVTGGGSGSPAGSGGARVVLPSALLDSGPLWADSGERDGIYTEYQDPDGKPHDAAVRVVKLLLKDPLTGAQAVLGVNMEAIAWDVLSDMLNQMDDDGRGNGDAEGGAFRAATGMTFTLTAGYVSWLLRAGYLSASIMSALPLWREFDPLPVLGGKRGEKDRKDGKDAKDPDESPDLGPEDLLFQVDGG